MGCDDSNIGSLVEKASQVVKAKLYEVRRVGFTYV